LVWRIDGRPRLLCFVGIERVAAIPGQRRRTTCSVHRQVPDRLAIEVGTWVSPARLIRVPDRLINCHGQRK